MGKHSYGASFNRYMLYGILQDDDRFKYRRGLMVGLQHFSEESFVGLTETLCDTVKEHGPITIKEIQALLSNQRAVLDVTIGITLDTNEECIKVGPSQYDYIKRVFPQHLSLTDLTDAIFLALIDGPKTITYIKNTLADIGIEIKTYPLISWIDKQDELNRNRKLVSLSEIPERIQAYINEYDKVIADTSSIDKTIEKLSSSDCLKTSKLYKLDARLNKKTSNSEHDEDDELDKILGDFGF
jgi:RNA polymerase primary sigma factor